VLDNDFDRKYVTLIQISEPSRFTPRAVCFLVRLLTLYDLIGTKTHMIRGRKSLVKNGWNMYESNFQFSRFVCWRLFKYQYSLLYYLNVWIHFINN